MWSIGARTPSHRRRLRNSILEDRIREQEMVAVVLIKVDNVK